MPNDLRNPAIFSNMSEPKSHYSQRNNTEKGKNYMMDI